MLMQIPMQTGSAPGDDFADLQSLRGLSAQLVLASPALLGGRVLGAPPPPAFAGTVSRGSKNHFKGQCRPCRFHDAPEKCPRGEDCNFCHFPHGEEKFAQMEALSTKARGSDRNQAGGRRPRTVAGPRGGGSGQRLALCDHLDLVGSWAGCQPRAGGVACGGGKLAEAGALGHALGPDRGAAWQALGAEQLKAILLSAQPEHYDD